MVKILRKLLKMTNILRKRDKTDLTLLLPVEILEMIFHLLSPNDLKTAVMVCRRWREVGESPRLWSWVFLILNRRNYDVVSDILLSRRLQAVRCLSVRTSLSRDLWRMVASHPGLRELEICRSLLSPEGAKILLTAVCEESKLKCLDLSGNDLSSIETDLLAKAISKLETVDITGTFLTCHQISVILTRSLEVTSSLKLMRLYYRDLRRLDPHIVNQARGKFSLVARPPVARCGMGSRQCSGVESSNELIKGQVL